ncbi:DNA/RNA polymerase [Ceratobasidium sp. AG-I]|nr:DNA/RNA polymerase [Ceratobasidium sp. AG-I]
MAPPSPSRPRHTLKGKGRMNTLDDGDLFPTLTYRHLHGQNGVHNPLRVIALCDNDAFYASCERVRLNIDPEQPLVVQQWTNLIAVNYPARKFGITRHESITEARKKCPNLMAVHVATYKEGDNEPHYWDDPSPTSHKVSLDHYRRESAKIFQLFQDMIPAGGEIEKASIDEVFIDYTIPARNLLLERYPQLALPPGPFDLDTPLPPPPDRIDWTAIETNVIPVASELPKEEASVPKPNTSVPHEDVPSSPSGIEGVLASGDSTPHSISEPLPEDEAEIEAGVEPEPEPEIVPGSDAPPTWHDVALSIGAELMRETRVETFRKLGYTLSAGIARNKMLAKLSASYRKPMAQSVLRNVSIPGYLGPMPFQKIRFLGGKLGDAIASQFGATTVGELREIELEGMQRRFGEESIWVWNVLRGIDYSEVKERTGLKSMMASKNVRPAITTFEQARHWLAVLAAELAVRLTDARKINPTVWPRTLVLHTRQGSDTRSKQVPFPFAKAFSANTILQPGERLWKVLFPGAGDLSVGVINVALGFSGLNALESGQRGIEGFFGTKGAIASAKKPSNGASFGDGEDSGSSMKPASKARKTASPAPKKDKSSSKAKRDFFGTATTAKRKHEVIDDSDSDIVEISPPPGAKRTNTGSSGQSIGSRIGTPTPSGGERRGSSVSKDTNKDKKINSTKGEAKEKAKGIASFFTPAGSGTNNTTGKSKTRR